MIERLRLDPERGGSAAAGAASLAVATVAIEIRMTQWSTGPRFIVAGVIAALILTIAYLAPFDGAVPRPYHSVLLVTGLLTLILALIYLARLLGASHSPGAGAVFWTFGLEAAIAAWLSVRFGSAVCALIAGIAAAIAGLAFIVWVFHPHSISTFRAILLVESLILAAVALRLRPLRARHAGQVVNAAGVITLLLGLTFLAQAAVYTATARFGGSEIVRHTGGQPGFGWKLYLVLAGAGLLAYAMLERAPGPGYLAAAVLLLFAALVGLPTGHGGSIVGWPLALLIVGGAGLYFGLVARGAGPFGPGTGPPAAPRGPATMAPEVPLGGSTPPPPSGPPSPPPAGPPPPPPERPPSP